MLQNKFYNLLNSISNIGEINLILSVLQTTGDIERWMLRECIFNYSGATATIPIAEVLIELAEMLSLVNFKKGKNKEKILLSRLGKDFIDCEYIRKDRLTKEQGIFLLVRGFAKTEIFRDVADVIQLFNSDEFGNLYINNRDKRINIREDIILRLLQQLRVAYYNDGNIVIDKQDKRWLLELAGLYSDLSEEKFLELLQQKRLCGLIAEEYVLDFEKIRLTQSGFDNIAGLVKRVSIQDVTAGYDILSADGNSEGIFPDRYIEVKGTTGNKISFFITKNEMEISRRMSKKYWIYCVLNINTEQNRKIIMMKDPFRSVFNSKKFKVEPILWQCMAVGD